jgi:hypothetical protein
MTNTLDSEPPAGPSVTPPPLPPVHAARRRERTAGHIIAIVVGSLLLLPGLGMLAGGAAVAFGQAAATDGDGYFRFTPDRMESDGVALASADLWLDDMEDDASPWVFDFLDVDLRLRVDGADGTDQVFVGIARSEDVERYLDGTTYSEVVEVDGRAPRYEQTAGTSSIAPPVDQDFWVVSAAGPGEQQVEWAARGGRWTVVVMNADGTPGVAADVEIGARSGIVVPVAVALMATGGIVVAIGTALIIVGARGRRPVVAVDPFDHVPAAPPFPPPVER